MTVDLTVNRGALPGGYLSKSVAGAANVLLTNDEARNLGITFTGALTGDIIVTLPWTAESTPRQWFFFNNTTGAQTLTVKGAIGTGLLITQGTKVIFLWTGADFLAWTAEL